MKKIEMQVFTVAFTGLHLLYSSSHHLQLVLHKTQDSL